MRDAWRQIPLSEIAEITIGRTPPRNDPGYWEDASERPFCTIADITDTRLVDPVREGVTERAVAEGKAKLVPAGSLLMSFKLSIGRTGIAARDLFPNEAIAWINPLDEAVVVLREYLRIYIPTMDFAAHIGVAVKGNTLNLGSLRGLPITLPPLDEQHRIVDLVGQIDRTLEAESAATHAANEFLAVARDAAVTNHAHMRRALGDVLERIDAGKSPRCEDRPPRPGEVGVLKVSAVRFNEFDPAESKTLPRGAAHSPAHLVEPGDVLMTRANGSLHLVGAACRVDDDIGPLLLCDKTLRLRPKASELDRDYLLNLLLAQPTRSQIERDATGSSGQRNISQSQIRALDVVIPPVEVQRQIASTLETLAAAGRARAQAMQRLRSARAAVVSALLSGLHEIPSAYSRFLMDRDSAGAPLEPAV